MQINKFLYFGDFFAIPLLLILFPALAYWQIGLKAAPEFLFTFVLGGIAWTLIEYWIHRYFYHHLPYLSPLHDLHHESPNAFIGVPSFLSVGVFLIVAYVPIAIFNPLAAGGATSGLLVGYMAYMIVHHATHHWDIQPGDWLYEARLRHMAHHYRDDTNFGITTGLWDRVFGTARERRRVQRSPL